MYNAYRDIIKPMTEKPHYIGHRSRLREKVLKNGAGTLSDYELLEALLFLAIPRGDVKPLSKDLLKNFQSLSKLLAASDEELKKIDGVGEGVITSFRIIKETAGRLLKEDMQEMPVLASMSSVLDYCRLQMEHNKIEEFRVLYLNARHTLIKDEVQQKGTINHTQAYPREIVKRALEVGASSMILVHNHPSGDPTPSKADIDTTKTVMMAAAHLSIELHDHLIIGSKGRYYSFRANGLL